MKKSILQAALTISIFFFSIGALNSQMLLKDLYTEYSGNPRGFTALNETQFVFAAATSESPNFDKGSELLISDGTPEGTRMVTIINKTGDAFPPNLARMVQLSNNLVLFEAGDGQHGAELWRTDGTEEGTYMVKDIKPGGSRSYVDYFQNINGFAYFAADDGTHGYELWVSDGTEEGTKMVKDINPGEGDGISKEISLIDGVLYFQGNDGTTGFDIWRSDGTEEGTYMIQNMNGGYNSSPYGFIKLGNYIYFAALDDAGVEVYRTSGEVGSSELVADINIGTGSSTPTEFTIWNDKLFFGAGSGDLGIELYVYDEMNGLIHIDILEGPGGSFPGNFMPIADKMLFTCNTPDYGLELWSSDGTVEGTKLIFDMWTGVGSGILSGNSHFYVYGDSLYFSAVDGQNDVGSNFELWRSDGTTEGTMQLGEIYPGPDGSDPRNFFGFNGNLYFNAKDDAHGYELWTLRMKEIMSTPDIASHYEIVLPPFPHPAVYSSTVEIDLEEASDISLEISDLSGMKSVIMNSEMFMPGIHHLNIPMHSIISGLYFINLRVNNKLHTFKLIKI